LVFSTLARTQQVTAQPRTGQFDEPLPDGAIGWVSKPFRCASFIDACVSALAAYNAERDATV
jgi:hypothetical protein